MKVSLKREKYLAFALAVAALLLVGALTWEWGIGVRLERNLLKMRSIPVTPARAFSVLPEFDLPAADPGFSEIMSRSLFSVNRRSPPVAGKGGVPVMKKGQFVLVGVLITPSQRSALLRDVQTNKAETVALNGAVRGMTVGEVEASRVVLRQGAESEEITLNVQTGPKGAGVPRLSIPLPATAAAIPQAPPPPASPPPAQAASSGNPAVPRPPTKPAGGAVDPQPPGPSRVDGKKQP